MFKVGDKIAFVDENVKGVIVSISSNGSIMVQDEYGFERKCSANQLVPYYPQGYSALNFHSHKEQLYSGNIKAKKREQHIPVLDLHMENLVASHIHMSNHEIVVYQLNYFKKKLEGYLKRGVREFVVVHGIGSGKLKSEVRHILNGYTKLEYMDDHITGYGVGATRVFIR